METAKKSFDNSILQGFIPLDALSSGHLSELAKKVVVEDLQAGQFLFRAGDRDQQTLYLLAGRVELINASGKTIGVVDARSATAKHPLAHRQPRQLSARAVDTVTVVRVDSGLLDVLLAWGESAAYNVEDIAADENDDWLTRLLQSDTFSRLPPANIQQLLMRMESVAVSAGEVVVHEGEAGEYFYIVKSGHLSVTRQGAVNGDAVLLAELSEGDCFGEEALVAGTQRNATVTMLNDGVLMRVAQQDFDALLRTPLVQTLVYAEALEAVRSGAQWLDVRLAEEYANCHVADSLNIPLSELRDRLADLKRQDRYITCCDTGRRSASAAFILSQHGLEVAVLENGLMDVPWEDLICETEAPLEEVSTAASDPDATPAAQPGADRSLAESAAQAGLVADYVRQVEHLEAENNRLKTELESAQLALSYQTDEMARVAEARREFESDLETARVALARAQNEQQNVLKEQSRLTARLREAETEQEQVKLQYEDELFRLRRALEKAGGDVIAAEQDGGDTALEQQLAEARAQTDALEATIRQLKSEQKQVLQDKEERIRALATSLDSERQSWQEQIEQLQALEQDTTGEADLRAELEALRESAASLESTTTDSIQRLETQLEQLGRERDSANEALQRAQQEADSLRAEVEVSRGLEAMELDSGSMADTYLEDIRQLKTELEAETAQRTLAEQEVSRWRGEAEKLEQALQNTQQEPIVIPPTGQFPQPSDSVSSQPAERAPTPPPAHKPQAVAGALIQDEESEPGNAMFGKWLFGLFVGALIAAGVLYWQPDLTTKPASENSPPQPDPQRPAHTPAPGSGAEPLPGDTDAARPAPAKLPAAAADAQQAVQQSVDEAVAAIRAIEAESRAEQAHYVAEPATEDRPVSHLKPVRTHYDALNDGGFGPRMVMLPAGSFSMGSTVASPYFDERPAHEVTLRSFSISKFEITFNEYDRFARATGRHLPPDEGWGRGTRPVINVSWDDALAYTRWLSEQTGSRYRLPTEAEWEYAARGGTTTRYWWGNGPTQALHANCFDCGSEWDGARTAPVGSFRANPLSLHETAGNVMEWTQDCYVANYADAPANGSARMVSPCDARVVRGGSYSSSLDALRSAARAKRVPQSRIDNLGFRVVRDN